MELERVNRSSDCNNVLNEIEISKTLLARKKDMPEEKTDKTRSLKKMTHLLKYLIPVN